MARTGEREPGGGAARLRTRFQAVPSTLDLPEVDHRVLDLWEREQSFEVLRKKNAGGPRFRFFDGPITANVEVMGVHSSWVHTSMALSQRYTAGWALE